MLFKFLLVFLLNFQFSSINSFVLPGKIDFHFNKVRKETRALKRLTPCPIFIKEHYIFAVTSRGLYNQTNVQIRMRCDQNFQVKIGWLLKETPCMDEFYTSPNISVCCSILSYLINHFITLFYRTPFLN